MISAQDYARRRDAIFDAMGPGSIAVFAASAERTRSHDTSYPYRAHSDLLYLTGFQEPEALLVLISGASNETILFVRERDPLREQWDGRRAGPEGALAHYGVDAAFTLAQLDEVMPRLLQHRHRLYVTLGQSPELDARLLAWSATLRQRRTGPDASPRAILDAAALVHPLRLIKSQAEQDLMRRAAQITCQAHELAMRACRPGLREYELQALIEFHFKRSGALSVAYNSIVGAGVNATILHYNDSLDLCQDGDLLLIDAGCELDYYAADITRTFPINGRFSSPQRDLYQAVLEVQQAAIDDCQVGLVYQELQRRAVSRLTEAMIQLGLLKGSLEELIEQQRYKRYYPHGLGHWLGMDVHDVGPYFEPAQGPGDEVARGLTLVPGMVLTIEPGLYIPAHDEDAPAALRGLGVRIEDDILITPQGPDNLTASCPKTIQALEAILGTGVSLSL